MTRRSVRREYSHAPGMASKRPRAMPRKNQFMDGVYRKA
jgi:hypothetical protein